MVRMLGIISRAGITNDGMEVINRRDEPGIRWSCGGGVYSAIENSVELVDA